MSNFLSRVLIISYLLLLIAYLCYRAANTYVEPRADFHIKKDTHFLFLGHSHPECAYNDSFIHNFENLAHSGESYYYLFPKAQKLIQQNPNIQTVFIEFTNNQITQTMDNWIWSYKYMSYRFPIFAPFIQNEDLFLLVRNNPRDFVSILPAVFKTQAKKILTKDYIYSYNYGGFIKINTTLDEYKKRAKSGGTSQEDVVHSNDKISNANLIYLHKIVTYLLANNKRVFLVRSPLHPQYECYSNEKKFLEIVGKQKNTTFIDLSKFPLSDNEYRDFEHINYIGANKLSVWFDKLIKQDIFEKCNKNKIYDYVTLDSLMNKM